MARRIDRGRAALEGGAALIGYGTYPVVLVTAAVVCWQLLARGLSPTLVTAGLVVPAALLCWGLEHAQPYTERWRPERRTFVLDLLHSLAWPFFCAPAVRAGTLALVVAVGGLLHASRDATLWPSHWPLGLQVLAGVLVADFGAYWGHRVMHLTRTGWRAHVVHHSPSKLHFLAAGRTHPLNVAITLGGESVVLFALGANPETLALVMTIKGVNGLLQHSNIDLRPGALSYLLATNEAHWWHHSIELDESNRNFGNTTMVWDHLFRTFFLPTDRPPREELGVADAAIPESFLAHLVTPFLLQRYERIVTERERAGPDDPEATPSSPDSHDDSARAQRS